MKKISKKYKPTYTVDYDSIETLDDIRLAFALGKHNAGLPLTDEELTDIVEWSMDRVKPTICIVKCECNAAKKKLPWYKRFWKWLRRK